MSLQPPLRKVGAWLAQVGVGSSALAPGRTNLPARPTGVSIFIHARHARVPPPPGRVARTR